MGFQPPYRSDITFKKERNFTFEEISALMHELGHCMHLLLKPIGSPVSQLPLDMRETVSVMTEMYCETDEFLDKLVGSQISSNHRLALSRNEYFYVDIVRNLAVSEYIHSSKFDPNTATVAELKKIVREIYGKYSPIPLAEYVNPLGGELSNYLIDGESRVGYLMSYIRAASILSDVKNGTCNGDVVFQRLREQFVEKPFLPIVSDLLESKVGGIEPKTAMHPLPPIVKASAENNGNIFESCTPLSLWKFHNPNLRV
jgi:hypothetical protein